MSDETAGAADGRRVSTMTDVQAGIFDLLQDHGLPATLDGLSFVCRTIARWHREDGELRYAAKFERFADRLHKLSLASDR